ncbi:MAG: response regulator transcription factor [Anaerolineae bacterium]|nr:response regulator transcription factor [Anaerolineae bacterium]
MPDKKILIIDDDVELLRWLEQAFREMGYQVYTTQDGEAGLHQLEEYRPDAVILDLLLPGLDGWETCRRMRQHSTVPIISITGMGSEEDYVEILNAGADDCLLKPFRFDVLLAKVEALLRREGLPASPNSQFYCDDTLAVDLLAHEVFVQGQPVHLGPKEYELLTYLVRRAGQVLPHHQILRDVWDLNGDDQIRNVHLHISRLRQKIEADPRRPRYILTVPRIGYRFKKPSH